MAAARRNDKTKDNAKTEDNDKVKGIAEAEAVRLKAEEKDNAKWRRVRLRLKNQAYG